MVKKGLTALCAIVLIIVVACTVGKKETTVDEVILPVEEVKEIVPEVTPVEVPEDDIKQPE